MTILHWTGIYPSKPFKDYPTVLMNTQDPAISCTDHACYCFEFYVYGY